MGYITFKDAINSAYYSAKENTRSIWSQIIGGEIILFFISSGLGWALLKLENKEIAIAEIIIVMAIILELWGIINMYLSKYDPVKYN